MTERTPVTVQRDIRRRFNNSKVASAIIGRAAEDFNLCYPDKKLASLRADVQKHHFAYPVIKPHEMVLLTAHDSTWSDLPIEQAILAEFGEEFQERLAAAKLTLKVKLGTRDAIGVYIVPSE